MSAGPFSAFSRRLFELTSGDSWNWITSVEVDSTNLQARRTLDRYREEPSMEAEPAVPPCCFVAWAQSAGRGRGSRKWLSAPGLGLYMTFLVPDLASGEIARLPMTVAVIVAEVLSRHLDSRPQVKWPNDVLSHGRKLAGILIESSSRGAVAGCALIGIGINVHHDEDSLPLATATSLAVEGLASPDSASIAARIGHRLTESLTARLTTAQIVERYRGWSVHRLGERIRCRAAGGTIVGVFAGFDDNGALLLERGGQIEPLHSSEIIEA